MTISRDQAQMIAALACASRPTGARQWHEADVMEQIRKLAGRSLSSVALAVLRAAADKGAERPEVIGSGGSHWGDTMLPRDFVPDAVEREHRCSVCGYSEQVCRDRRATSRFNSHEFDSLAAAAKRKEEGTPEANTAVIRALKDELAHRPTRPPSPTLADRAKDPEVAATIDRLRASVPGLAGIDMQETNTEETT